MYGLEQADILTCQSLTKHLATYGYSPTPSTPGLWRHHTQKVAFSLVVLDDLLVKYENEADAQHLFDTLNVLYTLSTDWRAELYCGLTIKWVYDKHHVNISMPGMSKLVPSINFKIRSPESQKTTPMPEMSPIMAPKSNSHPDSTPPQNYHQIKSQKYKKKRIPGASVSMTGARPM